MTAPGNRLLCIVAVSQSPGTAVSVQHGSGKKKKKKEQLLQQVQNTWNIQHIKCVRWDWALKRYYILKGFNFEEKLRFCSHVHFICTDRLNWIQAHTNHLAPWPLQLCSPLGVQRIKNLSARQSCCLKDKQGFFFFSPIHSAWALGRNSGAPQSRGKPWICLCS